MSVRRVEYDAAGRIARLVDDDHHELRELRAEVRKLYAQLVQAETRLATATTRADFPPDSEAQIRLALAVGRELRAAGVTGPLRLHVHDHRTAPELTSAE